MRVEMEHVDLIVFEHRVEEGGEGRKQARPKGVNEDRNLGDCLLPLEHCVGFLRRGRDDAAK